MLFLHVSCRKIFPKPTLPEATKIGANTFGCRINGDIFSPFATKNSFYEAIDNRYEDGSWFLSVFDDKLKASVHFQYFEQIYAWKSYDIVANWDRQIWCSTSWDHDYYYPDSTQPHELKITKLKGGIISGTFYYTAIKEDGTGDPIVVTDGRFDLTY